VRLALLAHHWRSVWEWDAGELKEAGERLAAWRRVAAGAEAGRLPERAAMALAADLDTPGVLLVGDEAAEAGDRGSVAAVAAVLGVVLGRA
jgi:L-cysteine:1D-myo-inositol 2-amino-2-deoxy-alpha-D-glucopyranoside ligase